MGAVGMYKVRQESDGVCVRSVARSELVRSPARIYSGQTNLLIHTFSLKVEIYAYVRLAACRSESPGALDPRRKELIH